MTCEVCHVFIGIVLMAIGAVGFVFSIECLKWSIMSKSKREFLTKWYGDK